MRNLSIVVITALLLMASPLALAVRVHSIYQAEVPVASRSAEVKAKAVQEGLAQVFVKVSGNSHIVENTPSLKSSLEHADKLAQEYSYSSPTNMDKATPYLLTIRFDVEAVNRLLKGASVPVWGQNRPLILVLLAYEGPGHPVDLVDSSTNVQQVTLKKSAKLRGVPVILPVMDVADLADLSVDDVVNQSITPLQKAAQRYASNAILIGHVTEADANYSSKWQLVLGDDKWSWNVDGKSLQEVTNGVINNVADTLAGRYSIVMSDAVQSQLTLKITGIKEQSELLQLMKYLQHLSPVADVQLKTVAGEDVTLDVSLRGNKQSFIQAVSLGKNMEPVTGNSEPDTLLYKWIQ